MALDFDVIGVETEPFTRTWNSTDALLYALGVGAGLGDQLRELEFTTENSEGVEQKVLPTYGVLVTRGGSPRRLGDFDRALLVHAEQDLTLHRPLPVEGSAQVTSRVTGMYDKGSGALVVAESVAREVPSGEPLVTTRASTFIRGEGGFGGERGPSDPWGRPSRSPDERVTYETRPEQALIYRLSGDRNPLHADPGFAARGGFSRPILHGLCTYGFTGRALLHALCGSDPARFGSLHGRFSRPVLPGDTLEVSIWADGDEALFQTATGDGAVVLDHGRFRFAEGR
jgi:acyl dehydratase